MILSFQNIGTKDIFNGKKYEENPRIYPEKLWKVAKRKFDQFDSVIKLQESTIQSRNQLESLKDNRKGQYSIRINDQYRICFIWQENGPSKVEIIDYHEG